MQETYIFIYEKPPKIMKIKQDIEAEMNPCTEIFIGTSH